MGECPRCGSKAPHLHPAMQFEGEVEICTHDFHLQKTPQNTPQYRAGVLKKRAEMNERDPTGQGGQPAESESK